MAINKFTDLTEQEFSELYLPNGLSMHSKQDKKIRLQFFGRNEFDKAPETIDWRAAGKVASPGDQSSCGSCWAFTTASTIESLISIKTNAAPVKLSVQHLVDCDQTNFGCAGGWMLDAYDYTKSRGLIKEEDYPRKYSANKGRCEEIQGERYKNTGANEEDNITNERLQKLVSERPVGIAMHSNPRCLMSYKDGILREQDCGCSDERKTQVNHAVTMIGYGKVENNSDCQGYWLIKNSWGPNWGDAGSFKLCIPHPAEDAKLPTGTCQVKSYVQYPTLD